jgi:hypothetical protein
MAIAAAICWSEFSELCNAAAASVVDFDVSPFFLGVQIFVYLNYS